MSIPPVRAAYSQWATTYDTDRNLTRDLDQVVTRAVLAGRRYRTILELGCGTGKNTRLLVQIGERVHAIDFSEGMLEQARAKGFGPEVTFSQSDITQPWPCPDQSVDLMSCNLVLEHIDDLTFVFTEAARVLAPAGHMFICELHPFKQYMGGRAGFQGDQGRIEPPAFVHHISDFLDAATAAGLTLISFKEWWHDDDQHAPPRLASFMFRKPSCSGNR
jgi:malonyl-CoA O-methyltransferase